MSPSSDGDGNPIFVAPARGAVTLPQERLVERRPARPGHRRGDAARPAGAGAGRSGAAGSTWRRAPPTPTPTTSCRLAEPGRPRRAARAPRRATTASCSRPVPRRRCSGCPSFKHGRRHLARRAARLRRRVPHRQLDAASSRTSPTRCRSRSARSRRRSSRRAIKLARRGRSRQGASSRRCPRARSISSTRRSSSSTSSTRRPTRTATRLGDGRVQFGFDSSAPAAGDKWLSKVNDIGMVVDLGSLTRFMTIRGKFDAENGSAARLPSSPSSSSATRCKPVIDILQVLLALSSGDYARRHEEGPRRRHEQQRRQLELRLPRPPGDPGREVPAGAGVQHVGRRPAEARSPPRRSASTSTRRCRSPATRSQLVPSAGAFLEFGGSLSVMCVSLAAATVYATGLGRPPHRRRHQDRSVAAHEVRLRLRDRRRPAGRRRRDADLHGGRARSTSTPARSPSAGFLLFRGRAELLGGLVDRADPDRGEGQREARRAGRRPT